MFDGPGKKEMWMTEDVEASCYWWGLCGCVWWGLCGCVDQLLSDRARGGLDWIERG